MVTTFWAASLLPSFAGRTVVITGASSKLSLVVATELARVGARVVLAVRDLRRGQSATRGIDGDIEVRQLDLANLASVHAFAQAWTEDIAVLINTAGVSRTSKSLTADGFETQFGVNHLGPFALTNLLLPHITDRVVTVSSLAHRSGSMDLADPNGESRTCRRRVAYAQAKLANLLFSLELQRRLQEARPGVRSLAAHPGCAWTSLVSDSGTTCVQASGRVASFLAQSADAGAASVLFAASQDVPGGSFIGPQGRFGLQGSPTITGRSPEASDAGIARRLWEVSEQLTGVQCPIPAGDVSDGVVREGIVSSSTVIDIHDSPQRIARSTLVAASASTLFEVAADPHRHNELDGSGAVGENVSGPDRLYLGASFTTHMNFRSVPYRITSRVTRFEEGEVIEWRHPVGHRWRWEFKAISTDLTRVTETFDYRHTGRIKDAINYYSLIGAQRMNSRGITASLLRLRDRFPHPGDTP